MSSWSNDFADITLPEPERCRQEAKFLGEHGVVGIAECEREEFHHGRHRGPVIAEWPGADE